ncbi:MAG: hypothetical protein ABGU93_07500 [Acetobacterium sp.]|uniref:hypothetical protein n=1 Tax=Acetobacterium sp. TaxID=1872094 RepID=UPI00324280EF
MKKKISKPLLIGGIALLVVIALVVGVVLMLFGGGKKEVSSDPLNLYNKVLVGMPKEEAEKILKVEGSVKGKGFNYIDENTGYGVTVSYDTVVAVTTETDAEEAPEVAVFKQLYVPDDTYLDALVNANVTADQVKSLKEGMSYEEVKTLFGGVDGIEINSAYNKKDAANSYSVMAWINPDRSVAYLTFLGYKGSLKVFEFRPAE